MSPINRHRLVHAVVRRVEVNEPENQVTVMLNDLGAGELVGAEQRGPAKSARPGATMEASP